MSYLDYEFYRLMGSQLKNSRLNKKYSLEEVGNRIGKTKKSIQRYETGEVRIDMKTLESLCSVLDLDCGKLLKDSRIKSIDAEKGKEVTSAQDMVMTFINNSAIAELCGYDANSLSDTQKIELANQTLDSLKFFATKYKKK